MAALPPLPTPKSGMHARALELLPELHPEDQRKFLKKFKTESPLQAAHSVRELLLGVYLKRIGMEPRHEATVLGKTPDWTLFAPDGSIVAIADQITLHQVRALDDEINTSLRQAQRWVGWMPDSTARLYERALEKAGKYTELVEALSRPYVVSVFLEANLAMESDEVAAALTEIHEGGVFARCPHLSGVLVSSERWGKYAFKYVPNERARCTLLLQDHQV